MQWDTCSLIRFDFSLIRFNPTTITWYPWRHRCERWLKKISWMVVRTWFWLWYYLCCIWFCSDLLSLSLLRDHIGCWHRHDQIAIVQDDRGYIPRGSGRHGWIWCWQHGLQHWHNWLEWRDLYHRTCGMNYNPISCWWCTQCWSLTWGLPFWICHLHVLSPPYPSQRLVAFCFCLHAFVACLSG